MSQRCKVCNMPGARRMVVTVSHRGICRRWHLLVCRDCWRAWEATLDTGTEAIQDMLRSAVNDDKARTPNFFW